MVLRKTGLRGPHQLRTNIDNSRGTPLDIIDSENRRAAEVVMTEWVKKSGGYGLDTLGAKSARTGMARPTCSAILIRDMAARGRLWGAERIRGELLKLGIKVSKRTIQKYMRGVRSRGGGGQSWATFLKNHAERVWVCDFIQTHDLLFRQVYAFFLCIWHHGAWSMSPQPATRPRRGRAQQLRNVTMDGDAPAVLLRDRDDKFGPAFDRAAQGVGPKVIRTAVRAPNMNALAEPFVASVRRELLDHVLLVDDQHLASLLRRYQNYFNESRPHQGLGQRIPADP